MLKLNVPFDGEIISKKEYMCSENAVARYLAYKGIKINAEILHRRGCLSIDSISKCLSEAIDHPFIHATLNTNKIPSILLLLMTRDIFIYLINQKEPFFVSIIPDTNWIKYKAKSLIIKTNIEEYYHTILFIGYKDESKREDINIFYVHDEDPFQELNFNSFFKLFVRTGYQFIIQKKYFDKFIPYIKKY
ncbi:MAG: hypothetical protein GF317_06015 [Candidatus Lokiarchaeota archaeon]|nr:hypothetical protein [Candidatus Lokiarchaeota archaeon]